MTQSTGSQATTFTYPWGDGRDADLKTEIFEFVAGTPDGTNLAYLVQSLFSVADVENSSYDYKRVRNVVYDLADAGLFKTARQGKFLSVDPTPAALHLTRRKHRAKTTDCDGAKGNAAETGPDFAKDRARAMLSKVSMLGSDSLRADMLGELGTELASVADTWNVFERVRGSGPEYLCLPYRNRFNSPSRASDLRASWRRAWRRARRQYDDAVVVTLTTDPKRHDSIADATDSLIENKNRLSSWLAYDPKNGPSRPGFRPKNLYVLEFTHSALPHLHVVFFGIRWLTPQWNLADKWDELNQGEIVDVRQLSKRGGEFVLTTDDLPDHADSGKRKARTYLGKSLRALSSVASMDPEDVADAASARRSGDPRDTDDALWKAALYWALERRFFGGSPELTNDDPDGNDDADSLLHIPCYRYVGTTRYADIPGYIRDEAVFMLSGKPPPVRGQHAPENDTTAD